MSLTFRIYHDENPSPRAPASRCLSLRKVGWFIDIDRIEDLQGLAGYGGRVEVTIGADDCRINLTPLETIRDKNGAHAWRRGKRLLEGLAE